MAEEAKLENNIDRRSYIMPFYKPICSHQYWLDQKTKFLPTVSLFTFKRQKWRSRDALDWSTTLWLTRRESESTDILPQCLCHVLTLPLFNFLPFSWVLAHLIICLGAVWKGMMACMQIMDIKRLHIIMLCVSGLMGFGCPFCFWPALAIPIWWQLRRFEHFSFGKGELILGALFSPWLVCHSPLRWPMLISRAFFPSCKWGGWI